MNIRRAFRILGLLKGLAGSDLTGAARLMGDLHGLPQKLGQHLNLYQAGGLGAYFGGLCAGGRSEDMDPLPVLRELKLNSSSLSLAAQASIGQVYRAVTANGVLAVKVKYPGIEKKIKGDLRLLRTVLWPIRLLPLRNSALLPLMDHLQTLVLAECDYPVEAAHQQEFARMLAGDAELFVPPVCAWSDRAIASSWVDGRDLTELSPEEAPWVVRASLRLLLLSLRNLGKCHADPHPGNFLMTPDRRLAVLDFGSVAVFSPGEQAAVLRLLRGEYRLTRELLADLGALGAAEDILDLYAPIVGDLASIILQPFYEDRAFDFGAWRLQYKMNTLLGSRDWEKPFQLPPRLLLLVRTLQGLYFYAGRNRVVLNWHRLTRDYLGKVEGFS